MEIIQREKNRPCPRVELLPKNQDAAVVLQMSIDDHRRAMVGPFLMTLLGRLPGYEVEKLIRRVSFAMVGNERIRSHLYPQRDGETE